MVGFSRPRVVWMKDFPLHVGHILQKETDAITSGDKYVWRKQSMNENK